MDQLDWILSQIRNPRPSEGGNHVGKCPLHDDKNPSCSVFRSRDVEDLWLVKCHNGSCALSKATNAWGLAKLLGVDCPCDPIEGEVAPKYAKKPSTPLPSEQSILATRERLRRTPATLERLRADWLIDDGVIDRFELGWDDHRVWLPVRDERGALANVRKYKFDAAGADKYVGVKGHNSARLYPERMLAADPPWLLLCEGEKDCLCAIAHGLPAVTATGGASVWPKELSDRFREKQVAICYDVDEAGRTGANKVRSKLLGIAKSVKVVKLPPEGLPAKGDLTDWFHVGGTREAFVSLMKATPEATADVSRRRIDGEAARVVLHRSQTGALSWRTVTFSGQVVGKDVEPFLVPRRLVLRCVLAGKKCAGCTIRERGRESDMGWVLDVEIEERSDESLRLIRIPREQRNKELAKILRLGCSAFDIDSEDACVLEEIYVSDELDLPRIVRTDREKDPSTNGVARGEPTLIRGFLVVHGEERITTNQSYRFEGGFLPNPRNQEGVHMLWSAEPSRESIASFDATKEDLSLLRLFEIERPGEATK